MIDWKPRAQALSDQLATAGQLRTPDWQRVFATVPRHEFVPSFFEHTSPGRWQHIKGRFCARYGSFMPMQHQLGIHPGRSHPTDPGTGTERITTLSPDRVHRRQRPFAFYAQLHLPLGTQLHSAAAGAGTRLASPDGSWCQITDRPDASGHHQVTEGGPQRLWQLIEQAHERYTALGRPEWERFGITATPTEQRVWLDTPDSDPTWPIPMTGAP